LKKYNNNNILPYCVGAGLKPAPTVNAMLFPRPWWEGLGEGEELIQIFLTENYG